MAGSVVVLASLGSVPGSPRRPRELPRLIGAALAQLPAVWILGALVAALFGLAPRALAGVGALAACLLLWFLGPLLDLPGWVLDLSPYQHVPAVPARRCTPGRCSR